jgi:integrase
MGVFQDKRTGVWQYQFRHDCIRYRQSGFATRDLAIQAEGRRREEVAAPQIQTPSISFQQIATEYLTHCQQQMAKNTWRQKMFVYRNFISSIGGDMPAENIKITAIRKYLKSRFDTIGPKAANRSLRDINSLFNWAIKSEIFTARNPCRHIENMSEQKHIPYVPPVEDIAAIKMAATQDDMDFIETLYHAVARKSEAIRLTWNDVNFEARWVRLWTRKRRGGSLEEQYKPMNDTLYLTLQSRWRRRDKSDPHVFQATDYHIRYMMGNLCERAGVKPFGFHAIRHHVLSLINDSGKAGMKQIQELAGHKRQSTTEKYLHATGSAVREAAGILDKKVSQNQKTTIQRPTSFGETP